VLYAAALAPAALVFAAVRLIYGPLGRTSIGAHLFYADYLRYISTFPFREIHTIVYDHLAAPTAFYITRVEFERWFVEARLRAVSIAWHNHNSWRGFGVIAG
jgi:hypothetical protein